MASKLGFHIQSGKHRRDRGFGRPGESTATSILKNLVDGGFPGALYPINPKAERILGIKCFKNVREIPGAGWTWP